MSREALRKELIGGFDIAHIGVSAAVTLHYGGKKYAVMELRQRGDNPPFLMLPSGYPTINEDRAGEDRSSPLIVCRAVLREFSEELLPIASDGTILRGKLKINHGDVFHDRTAALGVSPTEKENIFSLREPHEATEQIKYNERLHYEVTGSSAPTFVCGVNQSCPVSIDGEETRVPAYFYPTNNCVHFITGLDLVLPVSDRQISLVQAETEKLPDGTLCEKINIRGFVLLELDSLGLPTRNSYHLWEGELMPVRIPANCGVSEMLTPSVFSGLSSVVQAMGTLDGYMHEIADMRRLGSHKLRKR